MENKSTQDKFLAALCRSQVPVHIYIVNGIKLHGRISGFDRFVVMLKNQTTQMVYKQAISTISPLEAISMEESEHNRKPRTA